MIIYVVDNLFFSFVGSFYFGLCLKMRGRCIGLYV